MFRCIKDVAENNIQYFISGNIYSIHDEVKGYGYQVIDEDNKEHLIGCKGEAWFDEHFLELGIEEYWKTQAELYADMPDHDAEEQEHMQRHIESEIKKTTAPLIAALKFYADRENYKIWDDISNNCPTNSVLFDDGYRAREALKLEH